MTTHNTPHVSVFRSYLFQNQVALVTGGGTGIGRAIAEELASLGATVVIASRNAETCRQTAQEINSAIQSNDSFCKGKLVVGPATSIRNQQEVDALIKFILDNFHRLDMVVNNAGGQYVSLAEDVTRKGFQAVVETNLVGTFLVCQAAYQQYMKEHGGRIVNITLNNRNGMPQMVHSGAARAGIENMTKTLCTEWIESSVRINCVRPGIIFTESGFRNYGAAGDVFVQQILPSLPAKRFGSPQEVSSAVVWLLSEGSSYVTGTTLCVDGGGAYTFLPLIEIDDKSHLPVYGELPTIAKL
jgi:peroxisomal trans-2-enoyl-CoA reductase